MDGTAWAKLITAYNRTVRYVNSHIKPEINNLTGTETIRYVELMLSELETNRQRINQLLTDMEECEDEQYNEDTIFRCRSEFCKIYNHESSRLLTIIDVKKSESQNDDSTNIQQIKLLEMELSDADGNLKNVETFIAGRDMLTASSPISLVKFRANQLASIDECIDRTIKKLKILAESEERAAQLVANKANFDQRIGDAYEFVFTLIDRDASENIFRQGAANNNNRSAAKIRIESVKIPDFYGEAREWLSFRDKFIALIHNNSDFAKVIKYTYLQQFIKDKNAPASIRNSPATEEGYDSAWNDVLKKYNNDRLLVQSLFDAILKIKSMTDENGSEMQRILSEAQSCIDSMRRIESCEDLFGAFMAHIVLFRLDKHSRDLFETKNGREIPTWEILAEFLDDRSKTLDSLAANPRTPFNKNPVIKSSPPTTSSKGMKSFHVQTTKSTCKMCNGSHWIGHCPKITEIPAATLLQKIRSLSLCENCFGSHAISNCTNHHTCRECKQQHHTKLHNAFVKPSTPHVHAVNMQEPSANVFQSFKLQHNQDFLMSSFVMLSTAIALVKSQTGSWYPARCLIDSGSTGCFMTKKFAQKLSLKLIASEIVGSGMSRSKIFIKHKVRTIVANDKLKDNYALEFCIQDDLTGDIPSASIPLDDFKIPQEYQDKLADPEFNSPGPVDLVIGNIIAKKIEIGLPIEFDSGIQLQNTVFGWQVSGGLTPMSSAHNLHSSALCTYTLSDLKDTIEKFWKLEDYRNDQRFLTNEETLCEQHFERTHKRLTDGRFEVTIPYNENIQQLQNNRNSAFAQLVRMEKIIGKNPEYQQQYQDSMNDLLSSGHMVEVDTSKDDPNLQFYYLPHHGVIKKDSTTTKLRVVFNASSKTATGISLNDCQYVGPKIQIDASDLLLKTRMYKYFAKADIGKMYRMVSVDPSQRRLQRILWRDKFDDTVKTYELTTLTFGQAASSFLATRCVKQLAIENQHKYPEASRILIENTYVDDVFFGASTVEQLNSLGKDLIELTAIAGMELRKFSSNSEEFMSALLPEKREYSENYLTTYKVLGVLWSTQHDRYGFIAPIMSSDKMTKRFVLSQVASIFDPNGLLGPFTFRFKLFMKAVYNAKTSWDELLPKELTEPWKELVDDAVFVSEINFERYALVDDPIKIQLHGFSDASSCGYGAAIYLRSQNTKGEIQVHLLLSKSRGADSLTEIPRLELSSALILVHTMARVAKILNITELYYWMDSLIALQWIKKEPAHLQPFVAHRVRDIQTLSGLNGIWNHVSGVDNPADLISRGMSAELLPKSVWQHGSSFLSQPQSEWPKTKIQFDLNDPRYTQELKKIVTLAVTQVVSTKKENPFYEIIQNSSSLSRMKHKIAPIMRFIYNSRSKSRNLPRRSQESLEIFESTIDDLKEAEIAIARIDQMVNLKNDFNALSRGLCTPPKSPLLSLSPFWDENKKLIRVGGRLANAPIAEDHRFPIALSNTHLARVLAFEAHDKNKHVGQRTTIAIVNMKYWPLKLKSIVRQTIHKCHECYRMKPKFNEQFMGNLPFDRVNPSSAFEVTGVDYAGPIAIKTSKLRKASHEKAYIALFVCLATKAVHLEIVTSLSTEAFQNAYTRFIGRRGNCRRIMSDNGLNFIGARNEFIAITEFLKTNENHFKAYFAKQEIDWHTIPPRSPNMGGIWEAPVKIAKFQLIATIGNTVLIYEDLNTICIQIEAVMNSRPLTYINDDPNDPEPLTPAHFLIGRPMIAKPQENLINEKVPEIKLYRRMVQIQQHFWNRWSQEVLRQMQQRNKNFKKKFEYHVGQVILLHEDNAPPLHWPMGMIEEVMPGKDKIVRVVKVRLANGKMFTRAVTKISILPVPDHDVISDTEDSPEAPGEC